MRRLREPSGPPVHFPTGLRGVSLFREENSTHLYRVFHEAWYAFCVVDGGAAEIRYRGRSLALEPDRVVVFAPGNAHETRRIIEPGSYWVLLIPASDLHEIAESRGRRELDLAPEAWQDPQLVGAFRRFCVGLADRRTTLIERVAEYAALLELILDQDARLHCRGKPESGGPEVIRQVYDYLLREPLGCKTTVAVVARSLGWSAGYVSKVFSNHRVCPPKTLLRLVRVERARRMLLESDRLVKTAAIDAGFASPEKFNQAFRDAWNLSPTAYRNLASDDGGDLNEAVRPR